MEYIDSGQNILEIITKNGDIFYNIKYFDNQLDNDINKNKTRFSHTLNDFKQIIDSIQFLHLKESEPISESIIPFYTNTTLSTERGYQSFLNETDLEDPEVINKINKTINFREKYEQFTFNNSTIGIKFTYPNNWFIGDPYIGSMGKNCYEYGCLVTLDNIRFGSLDARIDIRTIPPDEYIEKCNCSKVLDYIKSIYEEEWGNEQNTFVEFLNDNVTTIDNQTAIQMEFISNIVSQAGEDIHIHAIETFTQVRDIFYRIGLYILDDVYKAALPEAKKIINSIHFIEMDKPKRPSFMQ